MKRRLLVGSIAVLFVAALFTLAAFATDAEIYLSFVR